MAPFPFFQRESLAELVRHLQLQGYLPGLELEGLLTGIDNLRPDVYLSPRFIEITRDHINRLLARDGQEETAEELTNALERRLRQDSHKEG